MNVISSFQVFFYRMLLYSGEISVATTFFSVCFNFMLDGPSGLELINDSTLESN